MTADALIVLGGYLLGSIPFGYVIPRLVRGDDIRRHGSGNVGASNVWRVYGRSLGIPVAVLDVAKGFVPALVGLGSEAIGWACSPAPRRWSATPGRSSWGSRREARWSRRPAASRSRSRRSPRSAAWPCGSRRSRPSGMPRWRRSSRRARCRSCVSPSAPRGPSSASRRSPPPACSRSIATTSGAYSPARSRGSPRRAPGSALTGRRDLRALVRGLVLVVAAVVVAGPASEAALSGQWCGTITTTDRLPSVTGRSIRVVLTFPSDGADRSTGSRHASPPTSTRSPRGGAVRTRRASPASIARRSPAAAGGHLRAAATGLDRVAHPGRDPRRPHRRRRLRRERTLAVREGARLPRRSRRQRGLLRRGSRQPRRRGHRDRVPERVRRRPPRPWSPRTSSCTPSARSPSAVLRMRARTAADIPATACTTCSTPTLRRPSSARCHSTWAATTTTVTRARGRTPRTPAGCGSCRSRCGSRSQSSGWAR